MAEYVIKSISSFKKKDGSAAELESYYQRGTLVRQMCMNVQEAKKYAFRSIADMDRKHLFGNRTNTSVIKI